MPRPRLRLLRWISAPVHSAGREGDDELRASMFRRMEAVLASAIVTLIVVILAFRRHPTPGVEAWLVAEACLFAVRAPLAVYIICVMRMPGLSRRFNPWTADVFILSGTVWSAALGYGCFVTLETQDPGLSLLTGVLAIGTCSGQCSRNPSSPRLNSVQMSLIEFPFMAGVWRSDIPLIGWCLLLVPLYLYGMFSITLQLHEDYATLILARMEDRRRALHCGLTGLPNRLLFNESLAARFDDALAAKERVTVLYLDLDGFKAVNDEFGHPMGDALLRQVADRLRHLRQGEDVAARLGGDEFAILMSADDLEGAKRLASRIITDLSQPFALTAQHTARIGVSIGIATGAPSVRLTGADAGADLLAKADQALYVAKRGGRGEFRVHDDVTFHEPRLAHRVVADLRATMLRKAS